MIINLTCFKEVAHILNEFLRPFQMDNPVVSFSCEASDDLLRPILKMLYPQVISQQS